MRRTFSLVGAHPLFPLLIDLLIHERWALVEPQQADLTLVGPGAPPVECRRALILSSSDVYSDRGLDGSVLVKSTMAEHRPSLVWPGDTLRARALLFESEWLNALPSSIVVRLFPWFGSTSPHLMEKMIQQASSGYRIHLPNPGYQVATHQPEAELIGYLRKVIERALDGANGVYNLGSPHEISYKRLAETVAQGAGRSFEDIEIQRELRPPWWLIPDLTRVQALIGELRFSTVRKYLLT